MTGNRRFMNKIPVLVLTACGVETDYGPPPTYGSNYEDPYDTTGSADDPESDLNCAEGPLWLRCSGMTRIGVSQSCAVPPYEVPCPDGKVCFGEGDCVDPDMPVSPPQPEPDDPEGNCTADWKEQCIADDQLAMTDQACGEEPLWVATCPGGCDWATDSCRPSVPGSDEDADGTPSSGSCPVNWTPTCVGNNAMLVPLSTCGDVLEPIDMGLCPGGCSNGLCDPCLSYVDCGPGGTLLRYSTCDEHDPEYLETCAVGCIPGVGCAPEPMEPPTNHVTVAVKSVGGWCAELGNGGDDEFDSNGPHESFQVEVTNFGDYLGLSLYAMYEETKQDWTMGWVDVVAYPIYYADPGCSIVSVESPTWGWCEITDTSHAAEVCMFAEGSPVHHIVSNGDTKGPDLGGECMDGKDAGVIEVVFRPLEIVVSCE